MAVQKCVVAGNWKMNLGPDEARSFMEALKVPADAEGVELLLFPPAVSVHPVRQVLDRRVADGELPAIGLGLQNIHWEPAGAWTGEISAEMAVEAGAGFALVGHSERRHHFHETGDATARKVAAALRAGLVPLLCVGETLPERTDGRLEEVLQQQLAAALSPRRVRDDIAGGRRFLLAYEPVWAIGTGETATPDDAARAHRFLRGRLRDHLDALAAEIPILYGGSVKPGNAAELLGASDVDGVLVGGASLSPESFAGIVDRAGHVR